MGLGTWDMADCCWGQFPPDGWIPSGRFLLSGFWPRIGFFAREWSGLRVLRVLDVGVCSGLYAVRCISVLLLLSPLFDFSLPPSLPAEYSLSNLTLAEQC